MDFARALRPSLAALTAVHAVALVLLLVVPAERFWIVALVMAFAVVIAWLVLLTPRMPMVESIVLVVLMFLAVAGYGLAGPEVMAHLRGGSAADLDIDRLPKVDGVTSLRFRDAQLLPLEGYASVTHRRKSSSMTYEYHVLPVVSSSWRRGEPVSAWAGCEVVRPSQLERCRREWASAAMAGIQVFSADVRDGLRNAIRNAAKRHHLVSAPDPLLLYWTPEPEARIWRELRALAIAIAASYVGWIVFAWIAARRRRSAETAPSPAGLAANPTATLPASSPANRPPKWGPRRRKKPRHRR